MLSSNNILFVQKLELSIKYQSYPKLTKIDSFEQKKKKSANVTALVIMYKTRIIL